MTTLWADHAIAIFLVAIVPFLAARGFRRMQERIRGGGTRARLRGYHRTIARQWILTGVILLVWVLQARPLSGLGLGWAGGTGFWIGAALTSIACGLWIGQVLWIRRRPASWASIRTRLEPYRHLLPATDREWRWWVGLCLTAGTCEELAYRGFLMAYSGAHAGTLGAVAFSSVAFALGHVYQGWKGILRTGASALILAGLYVLTGSLWAPMLFHFTGDLSAGLISRTVLRDPSPPGPPAVVPVG